MDQRENIFALLGDEDGGDGDDVLRILDRVSRKEVEKKQESEFLRRKAIVEEEKPKRGQQSRPDKQGQGGDSGKVLANNGGGHAYQRNNGRGNGYRMYYIKDNGYEHNNGEGTGYPINYRQGDGYESKNTGRNYHQRNYKGYTGYRHMNGRENPQEAVGYQQRNGGDSFVVDEGFRLQGRHGSHGYQHSNGEGNGYRRNYIGAGGYQNMNRRGDQQWPGGNSDVDTEPEGFQFQGRHAGHAYQQNGYHMNYGVRGGYQQRNGGDYGGFPFQGRHGNGRGRGRGQIAFTENNLSEKQVVNQGQNGSKNGGSQQMEPQGKEYRSEGKYNGRSRNGNRGYNADSRRYGEENLSLNGKEGSSNGEGSGRKTGTCEGLNSSERRDVSATAKGRNLDAQDEEIEKNMTLEEYEKVYLEKRKALDALNKIERKVTLDKDFESMQLVGKKNEDGLSNNSKSEDKSKRKEGLDNEEEKVHKSMNVNEFLKPAHGRGVLYRRQRQVVASTEKQDVVADFKDLKEFPDLGGAVKT